MSDLRVAGERALAEADALAAADLADDVAAGLVPADARRGLLAHERQAAVDYLQLDATIEAAAGQVDVALRDVRDRIVDAVLARARAADDPADVVEALDDPTDPVRLDELDDAASEFTDAQVDTLADVFDRQYDAVVAEADRQGVDVSTLVSRETRLASRQARRRLRRMLRRAAVAVGLAVTAAAARSVAQRRQASRERQLEGLADDLGAFTAGPQIADGRGSAGQAAGQGRQEAMDDLPEARTYYASELLDRHTCPPCSFVDGTDYDDLATAREDYPEGTYSDCDGGPRCRGTVVAVWSEEAEPTQ